MINDLITLFKTGYEKHGDKIILDTYKPDDGIYIRINNNGLWDHILIKKDIVYDRELFNWFKHVDYYSCLLDMNKPIDPKKTIHSNNYLTMFIKKDILPEVGESEKKLTRKELEGSIERYFSVFTKDNKDRYDKQSLELLDKANLPDLSVEAVKNNMNYILLNIDRLIELIKSSGLGKKDYVKVFFDSHIENYMTESRRYLIPKIFNKNDFNVNVRSNTLGLSNANMGLNSKKPYLESMTTRFKVAFRVDVESALLGKKIFDWIEGQEGNTVYIPYDYGFEGSLGNVREKRPFYYIYFTRGIGLTVEDFDYLPQFTDKIGFTLYNFLQLEEGEKENKFVSDDEYIDSLFQLEDKVNGYFFNGRLKNSYYQEPKVKSNEFSKTLLDLLITCRKAFHDYFKKGIKNNFKDIIDRISLEVVREQVKMSEGLGMTKAAKALNLRLSLLKYFKLRGGNMGDRVKAINESLANKLASDNLVTCENDDEFYFLAGQLAYYMLSQSEASKKTHGLAEPFLRAKSAEQLKKQLGFIFDRYKHAIPMNFIKFNCALSAVQGYDTENSPRLYQDMFLAGFLSKNIFYTKKNN
jgi:CRISPR-associated protein Csh1